MSAAFIPVTRSRRLLRPDGVSDRRSGAEDIPRVEVVIVVDLVVVNLGTNEEVSPNVVADASADVHQEMVAADERIAGKAVGAERKIEPGVLPAESRHQVGADLFAQARLVHGVEVKQDGTVGLVLEADYAVSRIDSLAGPPRNFAVKADPVFHDHVGAEARVESALFRLGSSQRGAARGGRHQGSEPEHGVELLGLGEAAEE
jgi:hypothetical protein